MRESSAGQWTRRGTQKGGKARAYLALHRVGLDARDPVDYQREQQSNTNA